MHPDVSRTVKKRWILLIEKDFQTALEKSNLINQYNETRKDLDKSMTERPTIL